MIVATAGHVDHGKTLLLKALTGVDTDRLPEEKKRGLSIDLGFAYRELPGGDILGFIDVPGHERFVRNMLVGVAAIDFVLFVVAADEGPMPQTAEHLAILDILGIERGAVALTKIDRAEPERIAEVTNQVHEILAPTSLAGLPIFPLSALTGEGVEALDQHLTQAALDIPPRPAGGRFRLAVDRCFTISGAGLVATGTVFSGAIGVGERLVLSPPGIEVRLRSLHAQNRDSQSGRAGQRCALNIAGNVKRADVQRGQWLLEAEVHAPVRRLDARLRVLPETKALRHWTPVHVHIGAVDVTGRLALLRDRSVKPGQTALVQLVLDHEIGALRGDHFVLRDQSAKHTLGGGIILDPFAPARGRARPQRLQYLEAMELESPGEALRAALLARPRDGVDLGRFARAWNLTADEAAALGERSGVVAIGGNDAVGLDSGHWESLRAAVMGSVRDWHRQKPDSAGPSEVALRHAIEEPVGTRVFAALIRELAHRKALLRDGAALKLPDHRPEMSAPDAALWKRLEPFLAEGGVRPPRVREVAAELGVDLKVLTAFYGRAARQGLLLPVADNRYFPPAAIGELARIAEDLAGRSPGQTFTAKEYRDATGIGRNLTIEVLEYFDKVKFTARSGDDRRLRRPAAELFPAAGN
ncbi:MAG TPA: selenocysteine-specific translation elongation factor [Alphaproteobacteria bacterium]|jgi:selenocysteine-specific elongation factor|nr:selenocysteine-specific translation elongation factor [Alphaproteobacteria bacterium]